MEIKNLMFTLCVMLGLIFACVYFDNECRGIRSNATVDRSRIKELEEVIKSGGKFEQFQSLMQSVYYDKIQKIKQIIEDDSEYSDYWDDYD